MVFVCILGHGGKAHDETECQNGKSDDYVWPNQYLQVCLFDGFKFFHGQLCPFRRAHGIHSCLYEHHGGKHAQ